MNIGAITNEHFQKNFNSKQADCSLQRDMQPSRIVKGDYFSRSKHNKGSKSISGTLPESKGSSRSDKKSNEIKFEGFPRPVFKGDIKKAWQNKEIPLVLKGYYGDKLTFDNIGVKLINNCPVLVGNKTKGHVTNNDIVDYFLQFARYPKYRRYILDNIERVG